jgi:CheY-like chemotaxis protein
LLPLHRVSGAVDARRPFSPKTSRSSFPGVPDLNGFELAPLIREKFGSRMRLIALTGYGQPEDRRRSAEAGFDDHLVKPVAAEDVAQVLAH